MGSGASFGIPLPDPVVRGSGDETKAFGKGSELRFGRLSLRDVLRDADIASNRSGRLAHGKASIPDPPHGAVLPDEAVLVIEG